MVLSYLEVNGILEDLYDRQLFQKEMIASYVLLPYINSLGFNPFSISEVERVSDTSFLVSAMDDIQFVFSVGDTREEYLAKESVRSLWMFDFQKTSASLYHKVFGSWELAGEVQFLLPKNVKSDSDVDGFVNMNKSLSKTLFIQQYGKLGEKLFSGSVVDRVLADKRFVNDFIMSILVSELKNPSDLFKSVLAERLSEFSLQSVDWISEVLEDLTGDDILQNLQNAVNSSELHISPSPQSQVVDFKDFITPTDAVYENGISLKSMGFEVEEERPRVTGRVTRSGSNEVVDILQNIGGE